MTCAENQAHTEVGQAMNSNDHPGAGKASPENASHNLGFDERDARQTANGPPQRSVRHADFAAEAHGFTAVEAVGMGGAHDARHGGNGSERLAPAQHRGRAGELHLCAGDRISLRLWENCTVQDKEERRRPYEIAGYVIKGDVQLIVEGESRIVHAGESFIIPAGTRHTFRIPDAATVIEATSPPAGEDLD